MNKVTKNKIIVSLTILSLFINLTFSVLTVWIDNVHFGAWFIVWAIAQVWLMLFCYANIDSFLRYKKNRIK